MKRLLCLAVVALAACAPPEEADPGTGSGSVTGVDMSGTYAGTTLVSTTCSDGSGGTQNTNISWTLADSGSSVDITTHGTCGNFTGVGSGSTVQLQSQTCPDAQATGGGTIHLLLHNGTVSKTETGITVAFEFRQSGAVTCTSTVNGDLPKQ